MRSVHSFPFTIGRDVSGCVGAASERGKATARYMLHMCVKGRLVFVARGHGHLFEINFVLHHHFFEEATSRLLSLSHTSFEVFQYSSIIMHLTPVLKALLFAGLVYGQVNGVPSFVDLSLTH